MASFPAKGISHEQSGRTVSGQLHESPEGWQFEHAQGKVLLPWSGLKVRAGGNNNEQVFLEHPSTAGWTIYTDAPGIVPLLSGRPEFATSLRSIRRERRMAYRTLVFLGIFLGLLLLPLLLLVLQRDTVARHLARGIPREWERSLGDTAFDQIKAQKTFLSDPQALEDLKSLTQGLVQAAQSPEISFRFHLMVDTNLNAFALPGGNVVVQTGLLEAAETPEELLGVLAHEIAHVTHRHSIRKIVSTAGLYLLIQALLGDTSGLLAVLTESSEFLANQKFSRDFEREADEEGWKYLVASGTDPRGMIQFFEKVKKSLGTLEQKKVFQWISTHPPTDQRIARLRAKAGALKNKPSPNPALEQTFLRLKQNKNLRGRP